MFESLFGGKQTQTNLIIKKITSLSKKLPIFPYTNENLTREKVKFGRGQVYNYLSIMMGITN